MMREPDSLHLCHAGTSLMVRLLVTLLACATVLWLALVALVFLSAHS